MNFFSSVSSWAGQWLGGSNHSRYTQKAPPTALLAPTPATPPPSAPLVDQGGKQPYLKPAMFAETTDAQYDTLKEFMIWWPYLDKISYAHSEFYSTLCAYQVTKQWLAVNIDDCLSGHTIQFQHNGKPAFEVGYWRGRLKVHPNLFIGEELNFALERAVHNSPRVNETKEFEARLAIKDQLSRIHQRQT